MDLYNPERPQVSKDRPALLGHGTAVPMIYVFPESDGSLATLTVFLPLARNDFGHFTQTIPLGELPCFFEEYLRDPEETLEHYFGWDHTIIPKPIPRLSPRPEPPLTPGSQIDLL